MAKTPMFNQCHKLSWDTSQHHWSTQFHWCKTHIINSEKRTQQGDPFLAESYLLHHYKDTLPDSQHISRHPLLLTRQYFWARNLRNLLWLVFYDLFAAAYLNSLFSLIQHAIFQHKFRGTYTPPCSIHLQEYSFHIRQY